MSAVATPRLTISRWSEGSYLISPANAAIEVRRRGPDDSWTTVTYGPGDNVELRSLGLTIPLTAFYRGLEVDV